MRKYFSAIILLLLFKSIVAQNVGIGTTTPNASAQLDVTSTTKGVLIPRMTDAEKNAIPAPVPGLLIYNTNTNSFQYYHGASWVNISHSGIINGTPNKVAKFNSPWGLAANGLITDNGAGVAINTTNALPNSSALLDITSTSKGILIPRMLSTERTAIVSPATGLMVYDNTTNSFWFYNGTVWTDLAASGGSSKWDLNGTNISNNNAGNVGIGTTEPMNKLQVQGNLLVTTPTTATNTAPTVAQTKTMVNASTITFLSTDSTGRIYDPGGPAGNYNANITANVSIASSSNIGIEFTAETMDLNTGDSLIIKESLTGGTLLAVGNGYTSTGKWVFNSASLYIIFKSNADANTGAGFSLLFRRLYNNSSSLPDISGVTGRALFFDSKNCQFRSGMINNNVRGGFSTAMGYYATASGGFSTAMGVSTTASGTSSTAIGEGTTASEDYSTAMGLNTNASGSASTAMGNNTTASGGFATTMGDGTAASGNSSTAMGTNTSAIGGNSVAMGYNTTASGAQSFAMGFNSVATASGSTAMGSNTNASGISSTAMGNHTTASGNATSAMGSYVSTNNQEGCFVIGDISTTTVMNSPAPNNFRARFANGYRLYTSADYTTSCSLGAGDNAWTTGSDVRTKENFAEVNGEDFLKKIAGFHLTSWNYKRQDPKTFRHYGPMAQDFHAAFGKDEYGTIGNDTSINSADFAGVSFIAIQALEKRTAEYRKEVAELKTENIALRTLLLQLRKEVDALKETKKESL